MTTTPAPVTDRDLTLAVNDVCEWATDGFGGTPQGALEKIADLTDAEILDALAGQPTPPASMESIRAAWPQVKAAVIEYLDDAAANWDD